MGGGRKVLFTNCGLEMWEPRFNGANDLLGGAEARMSSVVHVHGCTQPATFAGHVPRASSMPGPAHPTRTRTTSLPRLAGEEDRAHAPQVIPPGLWVHKAQGRGIRTPNSGSFHGSP